MITNLIKKIRIIKNMTILEKDAKSNKKYPGDEKYEYEE